MKRSVLSRRRIVNFDEIMNGWNLKRYGNSIKEGIGLTE